MMQMEPEYISVGDLFDKNIKYTVAKYQRAYSWKDDSLEDFFSDLKKCFERRKNGQEQDHFFGGILTVGHGKQNIGYKEFEIIDGQQRLTTFSLLIAALISIYKSLKDEATANSDNTNADLIDERITNLFERFIQFTKQVNRQRTPFDVLTLSSADQAFYKSLIHHQSPTRSRASHDNIENSYNFFIKKFKTLIDSNINIPDKMDDLEIIEQVVDRDFCIIHIITYNKNDAFRLFQVINDRGMSLTDGDLLRSRTLEMTDTSPSVQNDIEIKWNAILSDEPNITEKHLKWIYESYTGATPKTNALYDMYLDKFFPMHRNISISPSDINNIFEEVKKIDEGVIKCKEISSGQWPFAHQQPITSWDRNRLDLLISKLNHDLSIPLLVAATKLDHQKFSEIVHIIEKAFFRYKLICNQHATALKDIYYSESVLIRQNPAAYDVNGLKNKLRTLINSKANDIVFENALKTLEYKEVGGNNKTLKYLLLNVEYFFDWYNQGANGNPQCLNKSSVYDFNDTSIEHIYPRNAQQANKDIALELRKNLLGNLSIMDPTQNSASGNKSYAQKIAAYQTSSVNHLKYLSSTYATWGLNEMENNEGLIIDLALKVFKI